MKWVQRTMNLRFPRKNMKLIHEQVSPKYIARVTYEPISKVMVFTIEGLVIDLVVENLMVKAMTFSLSNTIHGILVDAANFKDNFIILNRILDRKVIESFKNAGTKGIRIGMILGTFTRCFLNQALKLSILEYEISVCKNLEEAKQSLEKKLESKIYLTQEDINHIFNHFTVQ
jgi:hypothetical protein